jgi:hypothetical protein
MTVATSVALEKIVATFEFYRMATTMACSLGAAASVTTEHTTSSYQSQNGQAVVEALVMSKNVCFETASRHELSAAIDGMTPRP